MRDRLPSLPAAMGNSRSTARTSPIAPSSDLTEAWLLRDRVGEVFDVVVLDADDHAATVALTDPAVRAALREAPG